jgi:2-polyprenyl-6-methoxyphenol hydroxylase-like FAD-dependent oxidoreductase
MSSDHKINRVAVIGTGIAGLATAAFFKQLHTGVQEVVVFDPHHDIEYNRGGAIGLSGGAALLELIGCGPELKKFSNKIHNVKFTYGTQKLIDIDFSKHPEFFPRYMLEDGKGDPMVYTLRWSVLRKLLKDAAMSNRAVLFNTGEESKEPEEQQTKVTFRGGKRFINLYEDERTNKVTLYFRDAPAEGDFDLVIGADGVRSMVRNHTYKPNQTILYALPFGSFLPFAYGNQYTGVRVAQSITPMQGETPGNAGSQQKETKQTVESVMKKLVHRCNDEIHQWIGDGSNVMTMKIGGLGVEHHVLISIYKEKEDTLHEQNPHWVHSDTFKEEVKRRLNDSGFDNFHDLHTILDATGLTGGQVFDVGVRDNLFPLRTWASRSGRVILVGDAAHAM